LTYDCAIIGGGPAGLNAALVLGRARRSVALFDNSQPRNAVTHASHGFITRDGVTPAEFRRIAYEEVLGYPSVLDNDQKQLLKSRNIEVVEQAVTMFIGHEGKLRQVEFADGTRIERTGGFITPEWKPKASFQGSLGYEVNEFGGIATNEWGKSSVPGVYAAGDAAYVMPSQLIFAAAGGSKAAIGINMELTEEDFV